MHLPVWQKAFEKYGSDNFTVVGIALDQEGIKPAKIYYDKYGVKFPSLVDPNYATRFGVIPKTFFVDEHGIVRKVLRGSSGWETLIKPKEKLRPVTAAIRAQWSKPGQRLDEAQLASLWKNHKKNTKDLKTAVQLASRLLDVKQYEKANQVLQKTIGHIDAKTVARGNNKQSKELLAQAYLQWSRANIKDRKKQVEYATMSFYLHPTIGYGKQIARIIAPEKFDRPDGRFDNRFREGTLRRLQRERAEWLKE